MTDDGEGEVIPSREDNQDDLVEAPPTPWRERAWNAGDEADTGRLAEELAERLQVASTVLLDRLFEYLSRLPSEEGSSDKPLGLTLPASAIGWLSTQLYPRDDVLIDDDKPTDHACLWMGSSMRDRLASLKSLLPRVAHLRVTSEEWPPSRPEQSSSAQQNQNFEGRQVDADEMSVQSTLTLESLVPPRPSLRAFLFQYYILQNRPRVDLQLFPSLKVLLLDRIPPEWVVNLRRVRDSLELLRTERACIYNLTNYLFPVQEDERDASTSLNKLTHLKLKQCAIGEMSGLRGRAISTENESDENDFLAPITAQRKLVIPPPFSRLPNLVSLSLAHNELRSPRTALAGLSSLPLLRRLDLSYNYLTHMQGANTMLGNLKELILTGNRIRTVRGLSRLYSLERLALDQNDLKDLASVAGLAKLPELRSLKLSGNPLTEYKPKKYRVDVLNLFREKRFVGQSPRATYRQLLESLPILDGKPASKAELVALRGYAFSQLVGLMENDNSSEAGAAKTGVLTPSVDSQIRDNQSIVSLRISMTKRPNRASRKATVRKVVIEESPLEHVELHSPPSGTNSNHVHLKDDSDITKKVRFSLSDLVAALPKLVPVVIDQDIDDDTSESKVITNGTLNGFHPIGDTEEHMKPPSSTDVLTTNDTYTDASARNILHRDHPDRVKGLSFISLSPVLKEESIQVSAAPDSEEPGTLELENRVNDEPLNNDTEEGLIPPSQSQHNLSTFDDADQPDGSENREDLTNPFPTDTCRPEMVADDEPDASSIDAKFPERVDQFEAILSPALESVIFPDYVWEDDVNSVLSSIKTNTKAVASSESKYQKAEEESIYDGLDHLKGLPVLTNLELYFRCYVFRVTLPEKVQEDQSDEEKMKLMLDIAPRIQLRPVDWRVLESAARSSSTMEMLAMAERFDKVWREEALACGKLAAKRLTPHRKPKRGFHGDVVFSNGKLEKSCECRSLIVCASDAAIYFISDYDAVARHQLSKAGKRRFPLPIPEDALFQNHPWPHALARHPIVTLERITIGFGFQRLALHFRHARDSGGNTNEEFTYILITCNKLRTVNLLQHFQTLTKEFAARSSNKVAAEAVKIDNDDKQMLDALAEAVAPSAVGMVLHYQIVQQRWQHGDRGTVRRACIVTDSHLYLLDEDYVGDGSESFEAGARKLGEVCFKTVDSATIEQVSEVQAGLDDPNSVTVVIRPLSMLQRYHRWRLLCRDREGAERLVEDIRKAMPEDGFFGVV